MSPSSAGSSAGSIVGCQEGPTNWRTWDRDNTWLHRDHPFMTWANAWMNLPCATWPVKQRTPQNVKTGKGLPPVLIVQSERDAGSHGVTGLVNPCVNDRVDTYPLTGKAGARDVTCAPHATPKP